MVSLPDGFCERRRVPAEHAASRRATPPERDAPHSAAGDGGSVDGPSTPGTPRIAGIDRVWREMHLVDPSPRVELKEAVRSRRSRRSPHIEESSPHPGHGMAARPVQQTKVVWR